MTSGTAARDQGPGTGAARHSTGTLVFVSTDGPVEVDASVVDQNIDCAEPTDG
jgi:2-succinyl-5-enolpyruvyl-6-hydroxy-3-cyclohexene-1-carboxylate synthase